MSLTFCLCHMVYGTTRKEYGILYLCLYLYCRIGIFTVFLYINIVILLSISIVCNKAIYIYLFPFLMFHLNFLAQVVPLTITASFLTCKGMAAQADTKHQSMLSLSAKIFCSRLPQSEIGYSTKILYRLFGLLPYWAAIL